MWTKEKLLEPQQKTVKILGDDVIIRKLKVGEVIGGKGSDEDKALKMIENSLIEPVLSLDEIKKMSLDFQIALQDEIMNFNGMDKKEANQGN